VRLTQLAATGRDQNVAQYLHLARKLATLPSPSSTISRVIRRRVATAKLVCTAADPINSRIDGDGARIFGPPFAASVPKVALIGTYERTRSRTAVVDSNEWIPHVYGRRPAPY
jgi:hypothetical protein